MPTYDLATKFSPKVDEAFQRTALKQLVTNNDYDWQGVDTVKVYSIPVVDLTDYVRSGSNRYGTPDELGNSTQTMQIRKDRGWTFTIDKLNKNQSMMVMDAGKAVARQLALKVIPEVDTYVFNEIAKAAPAGHTDATAATKSNAYSLLLHAQEVLGNANVPDEGRVALVSYAFAGLLKQDPAFMRDCDTAQNMQIKGLLGMVDGVKIIKVPSSRLPSVTSGGTTTGADFILTHPIACVAPTVLSEYKIHTDPPGISGWLVEGRISYDAFVLDNKADAIFYQGPALS
jgi:N4-gp56 family major capsid protein